MFKGWVWPVNKIWSVSDPHLAEEDHWQYIGNDLLPIVAPFERCCCCPTSIVHPPCLCWNWAGTPREDGGQVGLVSRGSLRCLPTHSLQLYKWNSDNVILDISISQTDFLKFYYLPYVLTSPFLVCASSLLVKNGQKVLRIGMHLGRRHYLHDGWFCEMQRNCSLF